jgi:biopolymer transport protein ExbD
MTTNRQRGVFKKTPVHIGPNMTPMVDVVMCILIFFMLGSTLATPELFLKSNTAAIDKAGLGNVAGNQQLPSVRMTIKLSQDAGKTAVSAFDSPPMPMDAVDSANQGQNQAIYARLADRRKTISDDVQVLIVPEANVPYQDVITIYDFCTKLKFKQVAFYPVK